MIKTIAGISGEVVHEAGSRKTREANARAAAERREAKRNDPVRAAKDRSRQHAYKLIELEKAVADAESHLHTLRFNMSELDAKSIQLEDLAFRKGKIQPSARSVEYDRVAMRPLIARAVQEVATAQADLDAHKSEAAASEIISDHDAEAGADVAHVDAPRRGRPPKVPA